MRIAMPHVPAENHGNCSKGRRYAKLQGRLDEVRACFASFWCVHRLLDDGAIKGEAQHRA